MSDHTTRIIRSVVHPLWALKDGSRHLSYLRLYEQTQHWSRERLEEMQWRRLEKLLSHAYEFSPFYRDRFRRWGLEPRDIQSPDDLRRLPVLTKEDIQQSGQHMVSTSSRREELIPDMTGGSTGRPLRFCRDRFADSHRRAATFRHNRMAGWDLGDKVGVVWGARRDLVGLRQCMKDLDLKRGFVIANSEEPRDIGRHLRVIPWRHLASGGEVPGLP